MNTDRDPIDPTALGAAVSTWLTNDPDDEAADQALIVVMLAQGVLTPDEASEALIIESEGPEAITKIHGGVTLVIDEYGTVCAMPD